MQPLQNKALAESYLMEIFLKYLLNKALEIRTLSTNKPFWGSSQLSAPNMCYDIDKQYTPMHFLAKKVFTFSKCGSCHGNKWLPSLRVVDSAGNRH